MTAQLPYGMDNFSAVAGNVFSATTMEPTANESTTMADLYRPFDDMPLDSNFAWLLFALSGVFIWMIYGSCFHSRVIGFVVGSVLNQYLKRKGLGELRIGSLKLGVVSGRLAFKNVRYINEDYSVIIYDGYIWFSYWLSYRRQQLSEYKLDPHRLFVHLYGLEIYVYNRTEVVTQLQKLSAAFEGAMYERSYREPMPKEAETKHSRKIYELPRKSNAEQVSGAFSLRSLFSVVDLKLSVFRVVLGNYRAPYCLVVGGSSASLMTTYEPATCELDPFATVVSGSLKNVEAAFQVNPDCPGVAPVCPYDNSNRKGRLKFFSTEVVQLNRYLVDSPTDVIALLVDDRPTVDEQLMKWSAEMTLVGRTDIIYGGWIDARRAEVHKAVFPPSRSELSPTNTTTQRSYDGFDLKIAAKSSVYLTLYLLDVENRVQKFILSADAGTEFGLFFPYVLRENGFTTNMSVKATHLRGVTSLAAKNLIEADEMNLRMTLHYSRVHHGPQYWNLDFGWTNVSAFFLYEHKSMIAGVVHDWTREAERPDLLHFVPFHVNLDFVLNGFELITYANQYNWIDCSKNGLENTYTVFSGAHLKIGFVLDFQDFLPHSNVIPFNLAAPLVDVKMYFPDSHAQHNSIKALYLHTNLEDFNRKPATGYAESARAFREMMTPSSLWVHTWTADNFRLMLNYCYHNDYTLVDEVDLRGGNADLLEPDVMELEMTLASSSLLISGSLAKVFYALKENYFGESQEPMSMEANVSKKLEDLLKKSLSMFQRPQSAGLKKERPLEVSVLGQFMDTTCFLLTPRDVGDPPCARGFAKSILLEVMKQWEETTLQLVINPIVVEIPDSPSTEYRDPLQNGQILVSYFQLRGHAMFSDVDMPPAGETLEYGWLMDFQVGDVVCRASLPQIYSVVAGVEGLIAMADDTEDDFIRPEVMEMCYHGVAQALCLNSSPDRGLCPKVEDIKYHMTRLSVDSLHIYVVDIDSCAYLQVHPIWMSTCNLRSPLNSGGLSVVIPNVTLKQFVWSHVTPLADQDIWIEATSFKLGAIQLDSCGQVDESARTDLQMPFLKRYDASSHRLKFLWDESRPTKCACFGGSDFFGRPFTASTWNGLSEFMDLSLVANEAGLEVGQRIFDVGDNPVNQVNIVSLLDLLSKFAKKDPLITPNKSRRGGTDPDLSPLIGPNFSDSSSSAQKSRNAWIPERRRPSVGSMESFYSAAENHQNEDEAQNQPESPDVNLPDILRDLDRQSVAAISQVTISTISMAPTDRAPQPITVSNFPVNLHAQLGKKTQESPLLMAGYVPQVPLWQRGIVNVVIAGSEHDGEVASKFSFYLPNFQKVKGGLDVAEAFAARVVSTRQRAQLFPRHYRSQTSSISSNSKFVDFGVSKASLIPSTGAARTDLRLVGCTDLMVTPMSCDALLPMILSLDTFVSKLRPSLFLSTCYRRCVGTARSRHTFNDDRIMLAKIAEHLAVDESPPDKKENKKMKLLSPVPRDSDFRFSSNHSGADSASTVKATAAAKNIAAVPSATAGHFLFGDQPWIERQTVNDQYSISIDQVNVVTLQCGIVEEIVGTKDLGSPRDLICVSVLSGSLRAITGVFSRKGTSTSLVKIYTDRRVSRPHAKADAGGKAPVVELSALSGVFDLPDIVGAESKVDMVTDGLLHISCQAAHAQLRRLKHSEIWRKAQITYIPENKSGTWFDYNPKQSPVEEDNPYKKLFIDITSTDQTGFIVLEMGVDDIRIDGGGRTESEEHITDPALGILPIPAAFSTIDTDEPVGRSTPLGWEGPSIEVETGSRGSGSSSRTFIAHPSEEDLRDGVSPDVGFKITAAVGGVWLNCPTPSKKSGGVERESLSGNSEVQLRSFTRLDWHFLSTANPVVDAWMYPLDRTNVALKSMSAAQYRNDITLASYFLIVAVNDHILPKPSRFKQSRHTLTSRVLQEDCCSRLARILQQHGMSLTAADMQHAFDRELMPPIEILEKGIFVLFKQLRYTPFARVLLEPQFLLQKFKPVFRANREPGTLDSSVMGLADDVDGLEVDDTFTDQEVRKHPESPYPPLEKDLNDWLDEETAKVTSSRSHPRVNAQKADLSEAQDDSDSPYEDGEFGSLYGPGKQASVENIFGPLLRQLGLQKKSNVSFIKKIVGFHVNLSGRLASIQIGLVESPEHARPDFMTPTSSKDHQHSGIISALRCNNLAFSMEGLLDIPTRCLDVFIPDYHNRVVLTSRVNRITVITYKFDMAELAQTVSMPLLRLLAQIGTVISNMQRVRSDLKKNWPDKKGHRKTDSTSTSGSGTSRSDSPGQPRMRGHDTYMDFVSGESSKHWKDLMNLMALYAKPTEYRVIDETRRTRRLSSKGVNFGGQTRSMSLRGKGGKKRGSGSENNSSSGAAQSDEADSDREKRGPLSDSSEQGSDHELPEQEETPTSTSRAHIDAIVQRRMTKTKRYGTRFSISGVAVIRSMTFEASLRGLNFQAALSSLSFNQNFTVRKSRTGQLDESFYQVRTGQLSVQLVQKMGLKGQLYLGVGLGSSQAAFSSLLRNLKSFGQRSLNVRLGELHFSVPHHPITLHSMVVRGAEDLTDAIDDLKLTAGVRSGTPNEAEDEPVAADSKASLQSKTFGHQGKAGGHSPIKATVMLKKLIVTAAPLPSLEGSLEISKLLAYGTIGHIAVMHFDFGHQDLKFKSKNDEVESTANFQLPPVYVKTSYEPIPPVRVTQDDSSILEFKDVHALYVTARAGSPEYTFGTDALKYTVLFQKVFMKEIEDVLDTLSQPITQTHGKVLKTPTTPTPAATLKRKPTLPFFHQINLQQDGIRITGTTPTSSAVRLEIDKTAVYVSNIPKGSATVTFRELEDSVISVQVDVGINLGQLDKGEQQMYEEAQPDFQPYAHFRTRMTFTNYGDGPLQELLQGYDERIRRKRIVAHLSQPRIYFQPRAVDMAVIFYINYKNAYEYWYEQRHGTVPASSSSRSKKAPPSHLQQVVAQRAIQTIHDSIYVIELFISQMYICMPLPTSTHKNTNTSSDRDTPDMAVLVSLDRTKVRAVLTESIIVSGTFDLFRLCFTEDRGPHYDYTGRQDDFTNYCFVPKGYLEVTSRTAKKEVTESGLPKWDLYFKWDMNGIETHMDPSIGKIISNLSDAMTLFTGEDGGDSSEANNEDVFRPKHGRNRTRLMEKQMQIHAKIFSELQSEGASQQDIQTEAEKLKRIEQGIVHEIRRDLVSRIRQKSVSSRGSVSSGSDARSHRRTSSTPQSDLSPTTPDAESKHDRTTSSSVDLTKARAKLTAGDNLVTGYSTTKREKVEPLREEPLSPRSSSAPEAEQSFDFDFTVLINIESGHCVFYSATEKERKKASQSASSGDVSGVSPARRGSDFNRRNNMTAVCTLYIPGVNLEIQYESDGSANRTAGPKTDRPTPEKTAGSKTPRLNLRPLNGMGQSMDVPDGGRRAKKKGNLFATCSLESLPAETVLTPQLLDFIEQALEPIPIVNQSLLKANQPLSDESDAEASTSEPWDVEAAVESFPVDIFVLFMMNSTKIRCSCLPVSKVEGVLTLPSLNMMVSTRKLNQNSSELDRMRIRQENIGSGRPVLDMLDEMLHHLGPDHSLPDLPEKYEEYAGMGLYGNLSGFSLVIFHPYGMVSENTYYDSGSDRNMRPGMATHGAPDKRELVRLELDRLHIEIVRSKSMVEDVTLFNSKKEGPHIANSIEFSAVVSVGKTTFWYDLRRLGEILAFPKAWYRRSIARRFFLGEEAAETSSMTSTGSVDTNGSRADDVHGEADSSASPSIKPKEKHPDKEKKEEAVMPWKTLVLLGLKVSALDFNVNMGNVMGNTVLLVEDINFIGRFSAASDGHSDVFACVVASSVDLNSRGGVVGGGSQWKKAQIYGHVKNEVGAPPMHTFGCTMHAAESRLEYMGAVSALARMSKLNVRIRDSWALQAHGYRGGPKLTATVNCKWDQMQAIICSASTSHVVKSIIRVTEFFEEQLKSSRQFLSTLSSSGPVPARRRSSLSRTRDSAAPVESRYHRHWQKPLEFLSGYRLTSVAMAPFPERGGVLRGDLDMNGRNISLACFYGNSFRGKSWARFSIKEPRLVVSCESQQRGDDLVNVMQNMAFHLGNEEGAVHAASVARVTCNNPPPLLNLPDWFEFMFMNSSLDEIGRFPSGHTQKVSAFQDIRLNMTIETILALPVVVFNLRSEQVQTELQPEEGLAPVVACNFNCDFGAPISIDMGDSQAFYFLHQLINSYLANTDAESIASKREVPNPTEVLKEDARMFQVNEWCLQPSFKLLQKIGRDIETIGVERVMNRLGFSQAQTTIPKWIQRGLVDPIDKCFAALILVLLKTSKHDRVTT
ncbi:hypothetical protein BV898_00346 [Hypsibius exemplaris]|uniref:Bridge-like lipid transfer protein family member 1 C-terminal domain-containing protein n=1 Tax=Hypsibius exemplaris TaxID=2072580 RepID=A0A1W0XFQ6_HYPEX|nr:hypothetical protein BV898_00346 [Hypsibius exemplaris]